MIRQENRSVYSDTGRIVMRNDGVWGWRLAIPDGTATRWTFHEVDEVQPSEEAVREAALAALYAEVGGVGAVVVALLNGEDDLSLMRGLYARHMERCRQELTVRYTDREAYDADEDND